MAENHGGPPLYDVMSTLRAVRRLKPDPIPDDVLHRVLQAACWAPTGGNQQPWKVIVVRRPDLKTRLADIYQPEWERYRGGYVKRMEAMQPDEQARWGRMLEAGDHLADHMAEAPVILLFCADFRRMAVTDAKLDRISLVGGASVYPPVQNLMLACVAEGLGCTLTTLHCLREGEVKETLSIPEDWATAAMVPIGYPVLKGHGPISRRGPEAMAYADTFGTPWEG
ncbi:MAG: nitroreductase family protein [Acidimicrobiia bacterium]|nr:nitroreductase family protein [Acidimicrobiia bacterium]MDH4366403.1 nitroreductase family protein [Acidimicrobiia bacterium]MDH5291506.1 nitroreductase family protein [Acidimicrobiia bacterium]